MSNSKSEASSVDSILDKLVNEAIMVTLSQNFKIGDELKTYKEAKAKINRLIVDEQLKILKGLKKMCKRRDTAMGDNTFVACVFESEIEQQIDELSNNLSKGDGDE